MSRFPISDPKKIARVSTWRARRKLVSDQAKAFCQKHGLNNTMLSKWETGDRLPNAADFEKMEAALRGEWV